jgi:hypothetical protein
VDCRAQAGAGRPAAAKLATDGVHNVRVREADGNERPVAHAPCNAMSSPRRIRVCRRPLPHSLLPAALVQPVGPNGTEDVTRFRRTVTGSCACER